MKLEGEFVFKAPRAKVWAIINDPNVLQRHMPGCEELRATGPDEFNAVLKIGVAAIKGTYNAKLQIVDKVASERYTLRVEGSGAPGFAKGEGTVSLEDAGNDTRLRYSGDLQIGGLIARVGQRLIGGIAERLTKEFIEGLGREAEV